MPAFLRRLGELTLLSLAALYATGQSATLNPSPQNSGKAAIRLQQLPLAFEPNVGQAAVGTDYLVRTGIMQAELSATGMRLSLPLTGGQEKQVSIYLEGARKDGTPNPADKLQGESNYLLGTDASTWHKHIARYGRVTYPEVYRGIDLTYYGNGSEVEHDFIVHPGATPSSIRLRFDGTRKVDVTRSGDLRIALDESEVTLRRPHAYQMTGGARREVPAQFVLADGVVSFHLGRYDLTQQLVIDPVLDYSTFLGNASVHVTGVAVDAAGDTYIAGEAPVSFPATANPATCKNCVTAANKLAVFVTKLNPAGTAVIYSTFIGGSVDGFNNPSNDQSGPLAVDTNGNAIVTGWTSSADFPLKNPIPSGVASYQDGFITSLTPDGSSLNFSSRLGGSSSVSASALVYPESLTTDPSGNVYVAGLSESPYLPTTPGALHAFSPSYGDTGAFLLKLSSAGALGYGAIVGEIGSASGSTGPIGLAVDGSGTVYMAGTAGTSLTTGTTPWPTTPGAYQRTITSPSQNAPFVTRISADGSTILSSTLIGTGSVASMALTSTHDVLIAGLPGYNFPVTSDAYNSNISTSTNNVTSLGAQGFFAKVSEDGTQLLYSSVFGPNSSFISINGIGEDPSGNVWLAGTTNGGLPALVHPLQSVSNSTLNGVGFIAEFDPPMHNLLFSSYVNSATGFSQVNGFALDSKGLAHVAGIASQDFPTTQGAALRTVTPPPPNYSYSYGFAALIDASTPGPGICFANASYVFTQVGTSAKGSFDIVNCGNGPLTVSSMQLTSDVFAFASANVCTGPLAAGASCTLTYTFTPKAAGIASATVLIGSDAPMAANMQVITGTGTTPVVFLPLGNSLTFAPQVLGTATQNGSILIGNKGTAPLIVNTSRTTITGPFSITATTCGTPVNPAGNTGYACSYSVAFNPTAAGTATGTLTIYTNDLITPSVTISITGTALASYPVPAITSLSVPTLSLDNGPGDVTIIGTNFFPASTVQINGIVYPVKSYGSTAIVVTVDPNMLGSMGEFPVQVVNPAPGGGSNLVTLTTYRLINLTATNVVYEPNSKMLYAAIPATSSSNPNTILPINPATGAFGTPIPVNTNPTRLTLSDDGHYLYVGFYYTYSSSGSLQRIDLTTGLVDRTFALPGSSDGIIDMHVIPGSPQLLVAALGRNASPGENGVALFNDAGVVQYIGNDYADKNYTLDNFTFTSDPTTFYGYPFNGTFFSTTSVSATSITPIVPGGVICCDQSSGSIVVSDGTLLYTNSGEVWDPKAKTLLGQYDSSLFYEAGIVADATAKRTFILESQYQPVQSGYVYPAVVSYDPSTFKLAGAIYFNLSTNPLSPARWGSDGFAFLTGLSYTGDFTNPNAESQLVLFRSSLATPGIATIVTVTSLSPASVAAGSPALTLTVNGSGFGTGSTVLWNGLVRPTTFVSASQLTVTIPAADLAATGTAQVSVSSNGAVSPSVAFVIGGPVVTLSTKTLIFALQPVAIASTAQTVTISNAGTAPLTGLSIGLTGADAGSFVSNSTCASSLAAGNSCMVSMTFNPTSAGSKQATLQITDSAAGSPQTVTLSGTAAVPSFVLSSQSLSFGQLPLGVSAQQVLALRNSSTVPLASISTTVTGQNATDFTAASNCGSSLAAGGSCTVDVTFMPSAIGDKSATVTIGAAGVTGQTVALSGTSTTPDFVLPAPTGPASVTVPAGQPANFNFNVSQYGVFTGTVTMSCTNLPTYASCIFTPASFTVGSTPTPVTLSISTQQTVQASLRPGSELPGWPTSLVRLAALLALPMASRRVRRHLRKGHLLLWLIVIFAGTFALNGCGGGSGNANNPNPPATMQKTSAGSYTVTVVATSGTLSHSTNVTLVVQ
jgi:hypothetical protein